jgi:hypothetical protein
MGFVKHLNLKNLSDPERKALKQLLEREKKQLQDALRTADRGLALLSKKAKKPKKAKKAK